MKKIIPAVAMSVLMIDSVQGQNNNTSYVQDKKVDKLTDVDKKEIQKTLSGVLFENQIDIDLFESRLKANSFINPKIVSRDEYSKLNGEFLVKKQDTVYYNQNMVYDLYIPQDVSIGELALITQKIRKLTDNQKNNIEKKQDNMTDQDVIDDLRKAIFEHGATLLTNTNDMKKLIGIDKLKIELDNVKKTKNKESITLVQRKIVDKIVSVVNKQNVELKGSPVPGSIPTVILRNNQIRCIGYSMVMADFLNNVGIDYDVINTKGFNSTNHAGLVVDLSNGKKYYADPMLYNKGYLLTDYNIDVKVGNVLSPDKRAIINAPIKDTVRFSDPQDPSKMLMGNILFSLSDYNYGKSIAYAPSRVGFLEKVLEFNPSCNLTMNLLIQDYMRLGENQKAWELSDRLIKSDPESFMTWYLRLEACKKMRKFGNEYVEAEKNLKIVKDRIYPPK